MEYYTVFILQEEVPQFEVVTFTMKPSQRVHNKKETTVTLKAMLFCYAGLLRDNLSPWVLAKNK